MLPMSWAQIRRRWGRALAMGTALILASGGFLLLASQAEASRLETVGTVQAHAVSAYDILVRPHGTRTEAETGQGLVAPGFLSGIHGGITLDQWHTIQQIPGVTVAAPIALLGYALPVVRYPVDVSSVVPAQGQVVVREDVTWTTDSGLTTLRATPQFVYSTSNTVSNAAPPLRGDQQFFFQEQADGNRYPLCGADLDYQNSLVTRATSVLQCFSTQGGASDSGYWPRGLVGFQLDFRLPYVVAAVDPASEDALVGLSSATISGSGLVGASLDYPPSMTGQGVPVLASTRVPADLAAHVSVSLVNPAAVNVVRTGATGSDLRAFTSTPTPVSLSVTAQQAYEKLLAQFREPPELCETCHMDNGLPGNVLQLEQPGPVQIGTTSDLVQLTPVDVDQSWPSWVGQPGAPAGSEDSQARTLTTSFKNRFQEGGDPRATPFVLRGVYDESKLTGLTDLTAQLLGGYTTLPTLGADDSSRALLKGHPLQPSGNLGGLVQAPPSMITTLDALPQLTGSPWDPTTAKAPLSAIRVKVEGVTGIDDVSRERVRLVADRISQATGLDLDVTIGASTTDRTLRLPAGDFGRPELTLTQPWLKKGVGVAIVTAVDRKSLALFVLVLLVSALTVANCVTSSVRARRHELGVLAGLGWRRADLYRLVLTETTLVAAAAGVIAGGGSLVAATVAHLDLPWWRAALAVPICLLVALAAAFLPARRSARATPMDALHPDVTMRARTTVGVWTTTALARVNLARSRARTLLATLGVAVAVAVGTALLGIAQAFQGAVVGTALGDAVALQARTADYAAGAATFVVALVGVAALLYLNIRERGRELATLLAGGWRHRDLARLITGEGVLIGARGAVVGAVVGVIALAALTQQLPPLLIAAGLAAAVGAVLGCAAAAYATTALVRRLPLTRLLTE